MNRQQAIASAAYLRKVAMVWTPEKNGEPAALHPAFKSINAAKRFGRTLGRGVALKADERFPK